MNHEFEHDRSALLELFAGQLSLPAIREAVLEGWLGRAWGNDPQAPTASRLDLGCYVMFGGDPAAPGVKELIGNVDAPIELIYPDPLWRRRILEVHGGQVRDRPMESFSGDQLDPALLRTFVEGLPGKYEMQRLSSWAARQIDSKLEPHGLQTYPSTTALTSKGMAWGVFTQEASPRLVSLASSYACSSHHVEVAISTRSEHRGLGLAGAVAASFCLAALDLGLEPCWNASNPVSKRLARRLGFRSTGQCEILFLEDSSAL